MYFFYKKGQDNKESIMKEKKKKETKKVNKRIGAAKKEMRGYDISLEQLDSIKTEFKL